MSVWGQIPSKLMTTQLALVGPRVRAASSNPHSVSYLLWPLFGHFTYLKLSALIWNKIKSGNKNVKAKGEPPSSFGLETHS